MSWRETYLRWKAEGRCVWCGSKKVVTKRHCAKHRGKFNALLRASEKRVRTRAARKKRLRAEGKCVICGGTPVNKSHCEEHRVAHNEHVRQSRLRRGG